MPHGGHASSAIPIRTSRARGMLTEEEEEESDIELLAYGVSATPPKISPTILQGGLVSPGSGDAFGSRCVHPLNHFTSPHLKY